MIGGGGLLPVYWDNVTGMGESVSVCVCGGGGGGYGGFYAVNGQHTVPMCEYGIYI